VRRTIGTCAINLSIYKNPGDDLDRDFQPVVSFCLALQYPRGAFVGARAQH